MKIKKIYKLVIMAVLFTSCESGFEDVINETTKLAPGSSVITTVKYINSTSATGGGNISSADVSITSRGVCWSTSNNPTTSDSKTADGSGSGIFTSSITGLTAGGTVYYVRAYATDSTGSTIYGNEVSLKTCGYTGPGGGLVFYDQGFYTSGDPNGDWRYMEAAPSDQGSLPSWAITAYQTTAVPGIDDSACTAIGTGRANTIAIVNQVNDSSQNANYPAGVCYAYTNNGYNDWFLPSKDELQAMYDNLATKSIGAFFMASGGYYFCSSEINSSQYYLKYFPTGVWYPAYKAPLGYGGTALIRPARRF